MMSHEKATPATAVNAAALLALQPGQSGGVALRVCGLTEARAMPATEHELVRLLRGFQWSVATSGYRPVCVLARAVEFTGRTEPGAADCDCAGHYEFLKGVLQALGLQVILVRPQEWQKALSLGTAASDTDSRAWKSKLKAEAQRRFPQLTVTPATAEALLMLDWAMDRMIADEEIRVRRADGEAIAGGGSAK